MQLNRFLTEYDDELSGDSYIDPLGVLVIWSAFGQQIFRNRVNSISNDVRNYTLNLLHHTLIRDLCDDDAVQPSKALVEEVGDKHSLALRQACLVYLENLFTYAMVAAPANAGVESLGILGASKARARLEAQGNPKLQFTHKKAGYLLVRQLGLGVSGRYKTPFMEMGFFNATYNYHHQPEAAKLWDKSHLLIQGCERLAALYKEAKAHLMELLQGYRRKSTFSFDDLPASLLDAYRKALPSPSQVGADTRDFWLDITGLASGAAGALLSVLDKQAQQSPELPLPIQQLFSLGRQHCCDPVEQRKLLHVQTLEPLLAEADLMFTLARHAKNQSISQIEAHWQALGRNANTLATAASQIEELPSLTSVLTGTGQKRLGYLLKLSRTGSFAEQLRGLLDYHAGVMRGRGQQPWVQAQDFERIKVNARTTTLPTAEKWPAGRWVNNYYIPQFRNLVAGYRGGAAMKLLNAFAEQIKVCGKLKRVWLTSFNIDIEFIETYLLPTILGAEIPRTRMDYEALQLVLNDSGIDFRVFCDRRFIGADQNKRTSIPVYGVSPGNKVELTRLGITEDSLFHAKVIYLEGEYGRVLGAGSANLTLSGWGRNQEVFHFVSVETLALYQSLKAFFQVVFANVGEECPLEKRRVFARSESPVHFCHSFQSEAFISQLFGGKSLQRLAVWSPYFPKDLAGFIRDLKQNFNQPQLKVSLVADRVDGQYLRTQWSDALGQLFKDKELILCQNPRALDERMSMCHAKLWKTSRHLAIGSWNFTHAGANARVGGQADGRHNNIEAGFIIADNSPIDPLLGKVLDAHDGLFATDEQLAAEALVAPEPLPFDIAVTFDWASQTYCFKGQWHAACSPEQDFTLRLPDHEKPLPLHWMPQKKALQISDLPIGTVRALLTDHCFRVFRGDKLCHVGMLIETHTQHRRAQQYDDLKSLFDAMTYAGNEPSLEDASYRVRETESGELLLDGATWDGSNTMQAVGDSGEISYFRLFSASYQYAARLHEIEHIHTLERWVFSRPGCLEELVGKAAERIGKNGADVFSWFLAQEVNGLCELAVRIRQRLPKNGQSVPLSRWRALFITEPELPAGANDAYRQRLQQEYQLISGKWGTQ